VIIPASTSLKDKRMILNRIKNRQQKHFNVAFAETDFQEKWQRTKIAFVTVSSNRKTTEETLNNLFRSLDKESDYEIINYEFDYT
jgi:uncharacterized protein YlxP (DUF503 family)